MGLKFSRSLIFLGAGRPESAASWPTRPIGGAEEEFEVLYAAGTTKTQGKHGRRNAAGLAARPNEDNDDLGSFAR